MSQFLLQGFLAGYLSLGLMAGDRPNFIIIFNDDQGYQDLGCYGAPEIKTPRIDEMASEGMRFTDFYVPSPVCSSSRAALLTGKYPGRVGIKGVFFPNRGKGGLAPEHVTLAEALQSVGYETAAIGKWHLGHHPEFLPTNQGFGSYFGIPYSNDMHPAVDMAYAENCFFREGQSLATLAEAFAGPLTKGSPPSLKNMVPLMRNLECVEFPADQRTLTERFVDEGIDFISQSVAAERPFFLYLANSMPHTPLFVSKPFQGVSERGLYGDVIEEIDFHTGRLLDHLTKVGAEENTLVVFSSDNGPWLVQKKNGGSALPLFEGKHTSFEGGVRVPAIFRWPGVIPPGAVETEMASTIDLLPTFARLAGAPLPEGGVDGKDIAPLLRGEPGAVTPHDYLFFLQRGQAVRSGPWKYHAVRFYSPLHKNRPTGPALYHLERDLGETTNVLEEHPEVAERLAKALAEHLESLKR
ncbi:MAG: sulfatase [Verrucomicrobiota bacterium]